MDPVAAPHELPHPKPAFFAGAVGAFAMVASCVIIGGHPQIGATAFVIGSGLLMIVVNLHFSRLTRRSFAAITASTIEEVEASQKLREEMAGAVQLVEVMKAAVNRRWVEAQSDFERLRQVMERDMPADLADGLRPLFDDMSARRKRDAEDVEDGTRCRDSWMN